MPEAEVRQGSFISACCRIFLFISFPMEAKITKILSVCAVICLSASTTIFDLVG